MYYKRWHKVFQASFPFTINKSKLERSNLKRRRQLIILKHARTKYVISNCSKKKKEEKKKNLVCMENCLHCISISHCGLQCRKQRRRRNNNSVQIDRAIIPDNCTALCTHNGARSTLL